ncbi:MAG: hypothetical protein ACYC10_20445 [Allorhizobium sp.]
MNTVDACEQNIATTIREAIFVSESSINTNGFGELRSYYSTAEPSKRPTIVVATDKEISSTTHDDPLKEVPQAQSDLEAGTTMGMHRFSPTSRISV